MVLVEADESVNQLFFGVVCDTVTLVAYVVILLLIQCGCLVEFQQEVPMPINLNITKTGSDYNYYCYLNKPSNSGMPLFSMFVVEV